METDLEASPAARRASLWVLALGAAVGLSFFGYYFSAGLTVAHYDAKAHLVVARRITDSLFPGYSQMGAHWLPLIHLLYLPLVVIDAQYRSGLLPSLISVCAFALSGWLVFRISWRVSGSVAAGVFAAVLLLANPNLLYLQSAPLTEPVYMALMLLALDALLVWRGAGGPRLPWIAAVWAALGALCRYEGWYLIGGVMLLLAYDFASGRMPFRRALKSAAVFAGSFALPAAAHFGYIYLKLGDTFFQHVARGNPAPYETYHRPVLSLFYHLGELGQIAAVIPLIIGLSGVVYSLRRRGRMNALAPLFLLWIPSLINITALYWGLMYRVRYSILLLPALAVFGSLPFAVVRGGKRVAVTATIAAAVLPWLSWFFPYEWRYHLLWPGPGMVLIPAAALGLFIAAAAWGRYRWLLLTLAVLEMHVPVLYGELRPMMKEALEHSYLEPERRQVLEHLTTNYDGTRILIDIGRLAPLIYDSGLPLKEFVYDEAGISLWLRALDNPEHYVGWLCVEKSDSLWNLLQVDPGRIRGYSLALQTDHFFLYRLKAEGRKALLQAEKFK